MAGTVYRRLNAFVDRAGIGAENGNQVIGTTIYKFLKRLEVAGYVTEIARNSGPGPGVSTGNDYYDTGTPFLEPAWAFFRWNASALRPQPHHILIQWGVGASGNTFSSGVGTPATCRALTAPSTIGFGIAVTSLLDNAGVAINPWNGSPSTTKGDPVWKTPGVGETLRMFPLSNNTGGNHATSRQAMSGPASSTAFTTSMYIQMIADADNLLIGFTRDAVVTFRNMFYMGTYIPLSGVTAPVPICCIDSDTAANNFPAEGTAAGSTTNNGTHEGGVFHSSAHQALFQYDYSFLREAGFQPNPASGGTRYERMDMLVGKASGGGTLGKLDPDFIRAVGATMTHGQQLDSAANIAFAGSTATIAKHRFPWDGATTINTGTSRDGVDS